MTRQIRRRGDGHYAEFIEKTHGNHVFLDALAEPNAGIEPAGDDIAVSIVDVHFEFYFRKFQQELRQQRADYYYGGDPRHAQSQRADRLVPERIDSLDGVVDAVQNRLRID